MALHLGAPLWPRGPKPPLTSLMRRAGSVQMVTIYWVSACVLPLYKGKEDKCDCTSFRGISLPSVVDKV